jgi:hypothetical protein
MSAADGYESRCPKCYTPAEKIKRTYHALGECHDGYSGTEHVHWTCDCGYKWVSYPR